VESRPVFADPSGRRHQILRFAGFGFMAAIAACLVAVVVAMTGGPQAPFTQWAGPPATAQHDPQQAGTVPLGHATVGGVPASGDGGGAGGTAPGQPGSPATGTTSPPSASTSAKPSTSAGSTPSATATPTGSASATATATHGKSGTTHGNPHNTATPTPTA
jgi:eukaryotic-like serine/threonine-protein kinase